MTSIDLERISLNTENAILTDQELAQLQTISRKSPEIAEATRKLVLGQLSGKRSEVDLWKPFTLIDAYKERSRIPYIVDGIFYRPSLSIIYSPPGSLKTMFLLDLLATVSIGAIWLPPKEENTKVAGIRTMQANVMFIDFDNGKRITHERIGAIARAREIPENSNNFVYYSMPEPKLDGKNRESVRALEERIRHNETKLIVIDNLTSISGGADENSTEMSPVMANFRELAEKTDAAIILIHHSRKSSQSSSRAGDSLRGHSSIEASLDLALMINRDSNSEIIEIIPTKVRGNKVSPLRALFTYQNKDDGSLEKVLFKGVGGGTPMLSNVSRRTTNMEIEETVIKIVKEGMINQKELVSRTKEKLPEASIHRIRGILARLVNGETISEEQGKNGHEKIYKAL